MRNKPKALQLFTDERLASDARLSKDEIARFLDEFQAVANGDEGPRKLISVRVPEKILNLFKERAKRDGWRYQTLLIDLMRKWVAES